MEHNIIWAKPKGESRGERGFIVLCKLANNESTPYVTWETSTLNSDGVRYRGHYHYDYEEAKQDFLQRTY